MFESQSKTDILLHPPLPQLPLFRHPLGKPLPHPTDEHPSQPIVFLFMLIANLNF